MTVRSDWEEWLMTGSMLLASSPTTEDGGSPGIAKRKSADA
jgi:hypothetical protein